MPRRKTDIRYGKARTSPSKRNGTKAPNSFKVPMSKPKGEREITRFVDEARSDGESSISAIRQFQQAECDHPRKTVIAEGPSKTLFRCNDCGEISEKVKKSG